MEANTEDKSTPRPWSVSFVRFGNGPVLGFAIHPTVQKMGVAIASINCAQPHVHPSAVYSEEELKANAELIVKAVNSYEVLREACARALSILKGADREHALVHVDGDQTTISDMLRAALADKGSKL